MSKQTLRRPSLLAICIAGLAIPGCLPDESEPELTEGEQVTDALAAAQPLNDADFARLGIDASAGFCFGSFREHAHSGGVARERINISSCSDGTHFSIDLTDSLCDNRAARVSWGLYDSVGLLASGSNTNGAGCNTTRTFTLPTQSNHVVRIHTILRACNSSPINPCSSSEGFDDNF